ncbi:MAG: outer membrane beta-barrel protein [Ahniella sp.]|nr:outer membrane beta-barrel protein [Ahniella sp.]
MKRLTLVSVISLCSAPAFAVGDGFDMGPLRVMPSVGLSIGHDSNVALTADNEIDSIVTRLSPGVRFQGGDERSRFTGTATMDAGWYDSSSQDDYVDYGLQGEWLYSPVVRHAFTLDAGWRRGHDSRGTAAREGNLALLPLDPDEYDLTNFGGKYRFGAPGARGRLELEAKATQVNYNNNRQYTRFRDRDDALVGAAFYWRIAPKTSALVRIDQIDANYEDATLDNTEQHQYVGLEFDATAKTSGTIMVGRVDKDFDSLDREDFSGTSWRAGVAFKPRTYSVIELSTGRETDETNGFGDFILREDIALGWSHQWSERWSTQFDVGSADEEHRGLGLYPDFQGRSDDTRFYGVSGQYQFSPWLRFGAGFKSYDRNSDIPELNYQRESLLFSLEASL